MLLDVGNRILKIQVKTTQIHKRTNQWKGINNAYVFSIKRKGSSGLKKYDDNEVDIFAVVTLDTKQIGYIKNCEMPTTINIRVDNLKGSYHDEKGICIYEKVLKLKEKGFKVSQICEQLKIGETSVRNYLKDGYKPYITSALYMSDLQREKEWFLNE